MAGEISTVRAVGRSGSMLCSGLRTASIALSCVLTDRSEHLEPVQDEKSAPWSAAPVLGL